MIDPAGETEPRIMLQILYNLLRHVEDEPADASYSAWAVGTAQERLRYLRKLARIYVKNTGGIV